VPRDFRFRLSLYLTLAAASVCLAFAEQPLLPGIFYLVVPVVALFLVALLVEGRWTLPVWAANLLGLGIAAGWGVWLDQRLFGDSDPWREAVPFPAAILPFMGPLLLLLLLVRLYRPKERRDFWVLHGFFGLVQVALGCVLGFTPAFGVCLFVYVVCALSSLTLFELRGGTGAGAEGPGQSAIRPRPLRWALAVAAVSVGLCLVLPRGGPEAWNPLRLSPTGNQALIPGPVQTGVADQIDLNRTGWVEVNDDVVMTVTAQDAALWPKTDLSPQQRWRGPIFDRYQDGRWEGGSPLHQIIPSLGAGGAVPQREALGPSYQQVKEVGTTRKPLFDLGPQRYYLRFELDPHNAGGLFLAEPVVLRDPDLTKPGAGVILEKARSDNPLFFEFEGTLVPALHSRPGTVVYRQVTVPPEEPDLSPLVRIEGDYLIHLIDQPVPGLTAWTRQLTEDLAERPTSGITAADLKMQPPPRPSLLKDHPDGVLPPERWEKVARALTNYLAHSPEYTYSLELRRQDWTLDPTFDFLCNVKEGHCERYAGGLALMLRALGVPSRIVIGYRGADNHGDGTYEVRNNQAHAWVEIPVTRDAGRLRQTHWLALDPTPEGEAVRPPWFSPSRWWEKTEEAAASFWRYCIVDYTAEQQDLFWSGIGRAAWSVLGGRRHPAVALGLIGLALLVPVCGAGVWLARRRRSRHGRPRPTSPVAFYRRLLAILARRRGLRPPRNQTPREFAEAARPALAAVPADLACLPAELVELLYRVRFGAEVLPEAVRQSLDSRLARLDAALAGR
jgi:transglutaminase-like putative cysteine protease